MRLNSLVTGHLRGHLRLLAAASASALALGLAGCGEGGSGAAAVPQDGPSPDETYSGVMPAADADPPEGYSPAGIEGVQVQMPDDWATNESDGSLCIHPPERSECRFGAFMLFPHAADRQDRDWPSEQFGEDDGWAPKADRCRSAGTAADDDVKIEDSELASDDFTEHADGLVSHASVWSVECENGDTFEVRLWYLPQSDVAAYVWSVDSRYDSIYNGIAESMDTTQYANS